MNSINTFVSNLVTTCQHDKLIREDGKRLTLFDRIADFFRKKHKDDHFKASCQRLLEASSNRTIICLSANESIEVLMHFLQIQKQIKNQSIKRDCHQFLQETEKNLLNKEALNQFAQSVFKDIESNLKKWSKRKIECKIRKLDVMMECYAKYPDEKKTIGELRIKRANLRGVASPHQLSDKDQLDILIKGFQRKEDEATDSLIQFLATHNPQPKDIPRLAKLASTKNGLSHENLLKLRTVLEKRLKDRTPKNWENYGVLRVNLLEAFVLNPTQTPLIDSLKRIRKGKIFFQNQLDLEEEAISIPRWYHATTQAGINGIIAAGEIQVRHQRAYKGVWVSNQREASYGAYVLALSNKITDIDAKISCKISHKIIRHLIKIFFYLNFSLKKP